LTCLGKIIGGGLPVGAFGGRADIMDLLAPLGPVYQAGTLSGNPLAMAAGIAALELLSEGRAPQAPGKKSEIKSGRRDHNSRSERPNWGNKSVAGLGSQTPPSEKDAYARLETLGGQLEAGMKDAAKSADVPVTFNRCGSMFCAYFTGGPVWNVADAMRSDRERFKKYFHGMLTEGIYLAPSQFEAGFISTAHSKTDIEKTVSAATKVLRGL
jgi:glutamate-1-semialdehyde 2,1-aminomutase